MQNLFILQHTCEIPALYLICTARKLKYSVKLNTAWRINHTRKSASGQTGGCWNLVSIPMKINKLWSLLFPSGSFSVLVTFAWLDNVGMAFLRKKAQAWWWRGRELMYVWGKMKSGEHPPARDASTTTSLVSGIPKAGTETMFLSGKSLLFLYPEPALLFLIKLMWVSGLMMELSAQLHVCCHSAESLCYLGSPMEQSLHYSISAVWGSPCLGFGGGSSPKLAGGIFSYGCMMNRNNVSFIAQNVSTFIGCYI